MQSAFSIALRGVQEMPLVSNASSVQFYVEDLLLPVWLNHLPENLLEGTYSIAYSPARIRIRTRVQFSQLLLILMFFAQLDLQWSHAICSRAPRVTHCPYVWPTVASGHCCARQRRALMRSSAASTPTIRKSSCRVARGPRTACPCCPDAQPPSATASSTDTRTPPSSSQSPAARSVRQSFSHRFSISALVQYMQIGA